VARSSGARKGSARGIGRATARLLANRGAAVCVNYTVHAEAAEGLAAEIIATGGRAIVAMADVAEAAAVEAMVARAEKELGPVTILVNNAGVVARHARHLRSRAGCAHAPDQC
jgi:NAD(P)-dependent dehydrogenase (short-subunit alcohol dehydrogenase family)